MKVELERSVPVPATPEVTWATLADVEAVAACMPGARITERIDERHYKGTVTVKVGPATLAFRGEIEVKEQDAANRLLHLVAKGTDATGSSAASLDLIARVAAAADGSSTLVGKSAASLSGKAAAFGGRMVDAVADQILQQFAANFAARVDAQQRAGGGGGGPDGTSATASAGASGSAAAAPQRSLNGLTLLWAVLKAWLRRLFTKPAG